MPGAATWFGSAHFMLEVSDWYYKLDFDPVARDSELPNGWKDVDYILVNDAMVKNFDGLSKLPQMSDAYKHSHVIEQWGTGQDQVQLRKIDGEAGEPQK
jgi:hypothetical protein